MNTVTRRAAISAIAACAVPKSRASSGAQLLRDAGVHYVPPAGWIAEDFEDHRGVYMYALVGPNDVAATAAIEYAETDDRRSIDQFLSQIIETSKARRPSTVVTSRTAGTTESGLRYGRVEYRQSQGQVDLILSQSVIPLGRERRIFVYTTVREPLHAAYAQTLNAFLMSVAVRA